MMITQYLSQKCNKKAATTDDSSAGFILTCRRKVLFVPAEELAKSGIYDLRGNLLWDKANSVKTIAKGFTCTTPFSEGAKIVIDSILAHPEYQIEDSQFDAWCDEIITSGKIQ